MPSPTPEAVNMTTKKTYSATSSTGWPGNALDSVQQTLADYHGHDMWADVIERFDGYDAIATAALEPVCSVPVFVVDGTGYQWCPELDLWQAFDAAAEIGEAGTDPLVMMIARYGSTSGRRRTRRWWQRFTR